MTDKLEIAKRVREARELAGLSQGQVAKKLGLHRPTISEIEAGRRNIKVEELQAFSSLYGVELSWLTSSITDTTTVKRSVLAAARELSSMSEEDLNVLMSTIEMIKRDNR